MQRQKIGSQAVSEINDHIKCQWTRGQLTIRYVLWKSISEPSFDVPSMSKSRYLKIDHVSEVNILIETLQYYKNNNKNKNILDENIDDLLSVCLELQKLFFKWG